MSGVLGVPYLAPSLGFDPNAYPQLAPLPSACRSLALQVPGFFLRRSYPIRWIVDLPGGTGDWHYLEGKYLASWNGYLGDDPFVYCDTRNALYGTWRGVLQHDTIAGNTVRIYVELDDPQFFARYVRFYLNYIPGADWSSITFDDPTEQGQGFNGVQAGPVRVRPVRQWERVNLT